VGAPDVVNRLMDEAHRPSGGDKDESRSDQFNQDPFECEQPLSSVWEGVGATLLLLFVAGSTLFLFFGPPWAWR